MPRTYTKKGVHTSPENAGIQNMPDPDTMPKDTAELNDKLIPIRNKGKYNTILYKGQWSDQQLADSIDEFFEYCRISQLKPTLPAMRMWLGISKDQFVEWRNNVAKYGDKSVLMQSAMDYMETYLQANIDKYPTGSIFLLSASHGLQNTSKLDVTSNGKDFNANKEEVNSLIANLGLDKE
jgi:hypothetical protein